MNNLIIRKLSIILLSFLSSCIQNKIPLTPDPLNLYISVKDFGAKGDGITDDTRAISNALRAIKNECFSSNKFENGIKSKIYYGTSPILYFPSGVYKISNSIIIKHYQQIVGENSILIPTIKNTLTGIQAVGWQFYISGIQFVGFNIGIDINNNNLDAGHVVIQNCSFGEQNIAIQLTAQSSLTSISNNRFVNNNKVINIEKGDKVNFTDNWISSGTLKDFHDAQIINYGNLSFDSNILVPSPPQKGTIEPAWINNFGSVSVYNIRQGGEPGSFTLINNFTIADTEYPIVPNYVIVENSDCFGVYGNNNNQRQPSVIRLINLPNVLTCNNLRGMTDSYLLAISEYGNISPSNLKEFNPKYISITIHNINGQYYKFGNNEVYPDILTSYIKQSQK